MKHDKECAFDYLLLSFRFTVRELATIDGGLQLEDIQTASDGTRKLLFKLTVRLTVKRLNYQFSDCDANVSGLS